MTRLTASQAAEARDAYHAAVGPWASDRLERRKAGAKHPVRDFLFEYYSFKPAHLLRWSPGLGVTLVGTAARDTDWPADFADAAADGCALDPARFPEHRRPYLSWAIDYLVTVGRREPFFGCFGLHEWAMVYRPAEVRHGRVPLRLGPAGTDAVVEGAALKCSHYDAYRFFTPDAAPRNRVPLDRETTVEHDQPGCVHVTMDLYKFATKVAPFCASDVTAATFALAAEARELDMRASPYDLRAFGLAAIPVETREGREEYVRLQQGLAARGVAARELVLAEYRKLAQATATTQI